MHLYTDEGDIDTTANHPFYVIGKGWIAAGDLTVGDEVYNLDRTTSTILGSEVEVLDEPTLVYNLEVEDFHSYFVGCVSVLVHNICDDFDDNAYLTNRDKVRRNNDKGEKGKTFRGGSKSQRDNWYGYSDKKFQKWWEREGKQLFGGQDLQNKAEADEAYQFWLDIGKPDKM